MDLSLIPFEVAELCAALRGAHHRAHPVGGCVRDLLLGRTPEDWDVATSALPEEVCALFPRTVPTGVKHGTVTVLLGERSIEVTTFRREGAYADGRHPDGVTFDAGLTEDLARRDFTMNAMALDEPGALVDPFGGQADLRGRLIRCVGNAAERFAEDALRMFRAVRFSAQLGFAIEENTGAALRRAVRRAEKLSAERVRAELEKLLLSPWPERGEGLFYWGLMDRFLEDRAEPDLTTLHRVAAEPLARWAALCALLDERRCIHSADSFLEKLRLDRKTIDACTGGLAIYKTALPEDGRAWRHALVAHGPSACAAAAAMGDAVTGGAYTAALAEILEEGGCRVPEDLALRGADLMALGYQGPEIGRIQARLLRHVSDHPEDNRREALLTLVECWR